MFQHKQCSAAIQLLLSKSIQCKHHIGVTSRNHATIMTTSQRYIHHNKQYITHIQCKHIPHALHNCTESTNITQLHQHNNISQHRTFASITTTNTTKEQFNHATEHFFDTIQDRFESDDIELNTDIDTQYSDGVLTVKYKSHTWVLNQHSVTRQIWLSSPVSGPSKYNYHSDEQQWLNERDGHSKLSDLLSTEWTEQLQVPVDFRNEF